MYKICVYTINFNFKNFGATVASLHSQEDPPLITLVFFFPSPTPLNYLKKKAKRKLKLEHQINNAVF